MGLLFNWYTENGEPALIFIIGIIWPLVILSIPFCVAYDLVKKLRRDKEKYENDPTPYQNMLNDGVDYE